MIAQMGADREAASLLCWDACHADDQHSPKALTKILAAKYFTTRAASRAAADAVQIQGAAGCHESSPVGRYYRDAKVMEIIEGTTQIHEELLGKYFIQEATLNRRAKPRASREEAA
jgi:alkylation response protein AidB-like acyl-CoA dehydrogenase